MISIKTPSEIEIMRAAGKILAGVMKKLEAKIALGISTKELDSLAEKLIAKSGAQPAFKNYRGFPAVLCVAVNDEIVHGVPSERKLKEGDIISLDFGLSYRGYCADMAITVPVGKISPEAGRLIRVTKKSLKRAIARLKVGRTIGDVAQAIQNYVEGQGFNVIRELCGHGIGRRLHEDPEVPNFGQRHKGETLKEGMVLAIEPMVTAGDWRIKRGADGFCFKTVDGSLAAHFEHTVAVGRKGGRVLTK